ncbi:hypothetical protein GN956_G1931 [Arapaima gigas]
MEAQLRHGHPRLRSEKELLQGDLGKKKYKKIKHGAQEIFQRPRIFLAGIGRPERTHVSPGSIRSSAM